ncbi:hypothetical protein, partial [Deinococcus pimensis]|uniref:hypothetical protein n=1 Tax=Deinococcus pimensis TaxID=309888 RepID=UPI001B7F79EF
MRSRRKRGSPCPSAAGGRAGSSAADEQHHGVRGRGEQPRYVRAEGAREDAAEPVPGEREAHGGPGGEAVGAREQVAV